MSCAKGSIPYKEAQDQLYAVGATVQGATVQGATVQGVYKC